jgi:hypothetical protein
VDCIDIDQYCKARVIVVLGDGNAIGACIQDRWAWLSVHDHYLDVWSEYVKRFEQSATKECMARKGISVLGIHMYDSK